MNKDDFFKPYQDRWPGFSTAKQNLTQDNENIEIQLTFGHPIPKHLEDEIKNTLKKDALKLNKNTSTNINITWKVKPHTANPSTARKIPNVKNMIAVSACKGGVGKSTTAVNLAFALANMGAEVGILDADVYGPNLPQMLGLNEKPNITPEKKFEPLKKNGLWSISIGYLVDIKAPMIWRGPMASKAFEQLIFDTLWPELDYLILDLPPGTGDIQLTLGQKTPISASVMVTTPQTVAMLDVQKGIEMFQKVNIPILGLIENMSLYQCSECGNWDPIFGEGGGEQLAKEYQIPFLGKLPIARAIREAADAGTSIFDAKKSDSKQILDIQNIYEEAALKMVAELNKLPVDYAKKFPEIRVG